MEGEIVPRQISFAIYTARLLKSSAPKLACQPNNFENMSVLRKCVCVYKEKTMGNIPGKPFTDLLGEIEGGELLHDLTEAYYPLCLL